MLERIIIFPSQGLHKKREKGIHHLARPTHLFSTLFLSTLLSPFVFYSPPPLQSLIPPQLPSLLSLPLLSSSFLPLSVCLSLVLMGVCNVCVCVCVCVCRLDCWRCRISRWSWKRIKEPESREFTNGRAGLAACCFCPSAEANYLKGPHLARSGPAWPCWNSCLVT